MIEQNFSCKKNLFALPTDQHYLNCATRGPFSLATEAAGVAAIGRQTNPFGLAPSEFFSSTEPLRALFSQLINNLDPQRIAVVPSVSYAMAVVARNLPNKPGFRRGQKIVLIASEFPSDVYAWQRVATEHDLRIETVPMPDVFPLAETWNAALLAAIDTETALVVAPMVHWMYGIKFDLEAVSKQAKAVGAWLAVDGTQSVGAMPFDVSQIRPDVLVVVGYKWLMGPYSTGLAYFGEVFDNGIPLEETWMGRIDSDQFHRLTDYQPQYRPKAYRYNMGEQSQFIHAPMLATTLTQLLDWQPVRIQAYCRALLAPALPMLEALGCQIEPEAGRSQHLVGVWLPPHVEPLAVSQALQVGKVSVSARGRAIRVSPNVYNDADDVTALVRVLTEVL
jgi:selenocysteine lyase/cysteine desulfurase